MPFPSLVGIHTPMQDDPQMGLRCSLCDDGCWEEAPCDCCALRASSDARRQAWMGGAVIGIILGFLLGLALLVGEVGCK